MKIGGVIKIGEIALPEKSKIQVGNVNIEYNVEFEVNELKDVVQLARTLPDAIADIVRKMKSYEDEFTPPDRTQDEVEADAAREVEMARQSQTA